MLLVLLVDWGGPSTLLLQDQNQTSRVVMRIVIVMVVMVKRKRKRKCEGEGKGKGKGDSTTRPRTIAWLENSERHYASKGARRESESCACRISRCVPVFCPFLLFLHPPSPAHTL